MCDIYYDLNHLPASERKALIAMGEMFMCSDDINTPVYAQETPVNTTEVSTTPASSGQTLIPQS